MAYNQAAQAGRGQFQKTGRGIPPLMCGGPKQKIVKRFKTMDPKSGEVATGMTGTKVVNEDGSITTTNTRNYKKPGTEGTPPKPGGPTPKKPLMPNKEWKEFVKKNPDYMKGRKGTPGSKGSSSSETISNTTMVYKPRPMVTSKTKVPELVMPKGATPPPNFNTRKVTKSVKGKIKKIGKKIKNTNNPFSIIGSGPDAKKMLCK